MSHEEDARPPTLSGSEMQRVAIARALFNQPPLTLAAHDSRAVFFSRRCEVRYFAEPAAYAP